MTFYYNTRGEENIDMRNYVENIIDEFTVNINKSQAVTIPSTDNLFKMDRRKPLKNNEASF